MSARHGDGDCRRYASLEGHGCNGEQFENAQGREREIAVDMRRTESYVACTDRLQRVSNSVAQRSAQPREGPSQATGSGIVPTLGTTFDRVANLVTIRLPDAARKVNAAAKGQRKGHSLAAVVNKQDERYGSPENRVILGIKKIRFGLRIFTFNEFTRLNRSTTLNQIY